MYPISQTTECTFNVSRMHSPTTTHRLFVSVLMSLENYLHPHIIYIIYIVLPISLVSLCLELY